VTAYLSKVMLHLLDAGSFAFDVRASVFMPWAHAKGLKRGSTRD
jgi:hypothetical protein